MKEYYSVDRRGFYKVGSKLDLFAEDPYKRPLWNLPGWFSHDELKAHLALLFSSGLSLHGWQYMANKDDFITHPVSQAPFVNHVLFVEILFEYVRRSFYPDRPSRMLSYFGFGNRTEALAFRAKDQRVYILGSDAAFRADQCWLTTGVQNVAASFVAHQYWSGEATPEPRWEFVLPAPVDVIGEVPLSLE